MTEYYPFILIDTGIIVAFYNKGDRYHQQVVNFFANCSSQLITTVSCITECMWLLAPDVKVQT
jgi:predicted nucleic acid-binding protein